MSFQFELSHLGGNLMSAQVSALLMKELATGVYSTIERLPSEIELSASMGVSRTVIRDALSDLEREGFIERIRGIGTVINRNIVNLKCRLDLKLEYNELIRKKDCKPSSDSIMVRTEPCCAEMAASLQLQEGDRLIVCEKRVLAEGQPVIYSMDYLPQFLFGNINPMDMDWSLPIFDLLDRHCGLSVTMDIAKIYATNDYPEIRKKLLVPEGKALIMLDEVGFCKLSRPVMRSFEYYTDFFDFTILRRNF